MFMGHLWLLVWESAGVERKFEQFSFSKGLLCFYNFRELILAMCNFLENYPFCPNFQMYWRKVMPATLRMVILCSM